MARLLLINRIVDEFKLSPRQAADELDDDPEHLAVVLLDVRDYLRCKAAYDRPGDSKDNTALDPWLDTETLRRVRENTYERVTGRKLNPGG